MKILIYVIGIFFMVFSSFAQDQISNEKYLVWPFELRKCEFCKGTNKLLATQETVQIRCNWCRNWNTWQKSVTVCPKCNNTEKVMGYKKIKPRYINCYYCEGIIPRQLPGFFFDLDKRKEKSNRDRRKDLYLALVDAGVERKLLYPNWVDIHFASEKNVTNLYNFLARYRVEFCNLAEFHHYLACDVVRSSFCD